MKRKNENLISPVSGEWRNVRLHFVNLLMEYFNETPRELGMRMGMTKQAVIHILKVDDCLLSRAHDIVNCHNCKLDISIEIPQRTLIVDGNTTMDMTGLVVQDFDKYCNSRTFFIRKAMRQSGHTMVSLHRAMNDNGIEVELATLRYWFGNQDNLYLSWVYKIAETLNGEVKMNISAMTEEEIEANPWKERIESNLIILQGLTHRVGRKPNWLKILEQEYAGDPVGMRKAIEERQRDEEIRNQLREQQKSQRRNNK